MTTSIMMRVALGGLIALLATLLSLIIGVGTGTMSMLGVGVVTLLTATVDSSVLGYKEFKARTVQAARPMHEIDPGHPDEQATARRIFELDALIADADETATSCRELGLPDSADAQTALSALYRTKRTELAALIPEKPPRAAQGLSGPSGWSGKSTPKLSEALVPPPSTEPHLHLKVDDARPKQKCYVECSTCAGTGYTVSSGGGHHLCFRCHGDGRGPTEVDGREAPFIPTQDDLDEMVRVVSVKILQQQILNNMGVPNAQIVIDESAHSRTRDNPKYKHNLLPTWDIEPPPLYDDDWDLSGY